MPHLTGLEMSKSDDIESLDYGSTHDYQGDIYRRSRYTVGFVIILTGLLGLCSVLLAAIFRSASVGLSPGVWLVIAVPLFGVLGIAALMSRQIQAPYRRIVLWLPILFLCVSIISIEIWFGTEEWLFMRNVKANGLATLFRARWQPFESAGLIWNGTTLTAHD